MTTEEFNTLAGTVEGQYQVLFGPQLSYENDVDGIERILPRTAPIEIRNQHLLSVEGQPDYYNPNGENETMELICQYVSCEPTASKCLEPFKPHGHCCEICGAMMTFDGIDRPHNELVKKLEQMIAASEVPKALVVLDKITNEDILQTYQMVIFQKDDHFNTEIIQFANHIVKEIRKMSKRNGVSYRNMKLKTSQIDKSFKTGSELVGAFIFALLLVFAIGLGMYKDGEMRNRFSTLFGAGGVSSFAVLWSRDEDGDNLRLINQCTSDEDLSSEMETAEENEEEPQMKSKSLSVSDVVQDSDTFKLVEL